MRKLLTRLQLFRIVNTRKVFEQIRSDRNTYMRRVQDSVPKMHVDCSWREENRMAVREKVGLRKEVLSFADNRRKRVAGGNRKRCSKGRGGRWRDDTNLKISCRQSIYGKHND